MDKEPTTREDLFRKGYEHKETLGDGREVFVSLDNKGIYNPKTRLFAELNINNK